MLRRILSLVLILCMLCVEIPTVFAEAVAESSSFESGFHEEEVADDQAFVYKELVRGDRDADESVAILTLQNKLIELGYLRDAADGVYGGNTEKAVASFQGAHGLEATGVATPATQDMLFNGTDLIHFFESNDPDSVTYRTKEKLELWGFTDNVPNGKVNQTTGDGVAAFRRYLRTHYLEMHPTPEPEATPEPTPSSGFGDAAIALDTPIGDETDITQDVLDFVDGKYEFQIYNTTLSNGDEGEEVLRVQRRLYKLKYLAIADGSFGANTERALLYFQKKNGLSQSAVADEATQRLLFSDAAVPSEEFVNAYKFVIDVSEQRVHVYQWNGSDYSTKVGKMICSTGTKANPTPLGTFQAAGPTGTGEWYWFSTYECYAKWATRIVGGILFHSIPYSKKKRINSYAERKLGRRASHGCIRLKVEHAEWIYENCTPGTTVVVQE